MFKCYSRETDPFVVSTVAGGWPVEMGVPVGGLLLVGTGLPPCRVAQGAVLHVLVGADV